MPEVPELLVDTVVGFFWSAHEMLTFTIVGILISILFNRKEWRLAIDRCFPSSLRLNSLIFTFNALFVGIPLGMVVGWSELVAKSARIGLSPSMFEEIPNWAVALSVFFVGDLIGYFRHRFEHSALLWPSHVLHHSDEEMTWFTLFRFHPFNRITTAFIDLGVLHALGFPLWAITLNGLVRHYYGMFIHMNLPWTFGLAGRIFVSPAMHRWHHVREGQGIRSNFATIFSLFDQIFGTYYVPGPCNAALGVEGVRSNDFWAQMMLPFTTLGQKIESLLKPLTGR